MYNEGLILKDGRWMPRLGQGTWRMGEKTNREREEIESLRLGIERGMTMIDTAEMYGEGGAEKVVGKAIAPFRRDRLFLVSKVYPYNAGGDDLRRSCEQSLRRLGTDYLDLYLLHWPGSVPIAETIRGMEELKKAGKIRGWGVSNFDAQGMESVIRTPGGGACLADQVLYHLGSRGVEYDLLPWCRQNGVALTAYCPVAQGGRLRDRLLRSEVLKRIAQAHGVNVIQLLLAFVLSHEDVAAIPKAATPKHVRENAAVRDVELSPSETEAISNAFPAPDHPTPLDIQ